MPYDDPGDKPHEDQGSAFAYGMRLRWKGSPQPVSNGPAKDGWRFADAIRNALGI